MTTRIYTFVVVDGQKTRSVEMMGRYKARKESQLHKIFTPPKALVMVVVVVKGVAVHPLKDVAGDPSTQFTCLSSVLWSDPLTTN